MKRGLKRALAAPFILLAAIIVLLESWLWDDLQRFAALIGRLPLLRQLEAFVAGLPPYAALAIFATPSLLLIPVKLVALYFIAHGQPTLGVATVIAAKIAGTALVARIFTLTRPKLMGIGWFARLYERFVTFNSRVHALVHATGVYKVARRLRLRMRAAVAAYSRKRRTVWRSRWEAALKLSRKWRRLKQG